MAVIALGSAAGSPGVTTSAVGLALTWPRPVLLIEADPTGGSAMLAGFFRGTTAHPAGLIDLAWAQREGLLTDALAELPMPVPDSSASLLPGIRSHTQAGSLAALWEPLAAALNGLHDTGRDVIIDGGRLGLHGSPEPLIYAADLMLLVMRSDLVALGRPRPGLSRRAVQVTSAKRSDRRHSAETYVHVGFDRAESEADLHRVR